MYYPAYDQTTAASIEYHVVRQFARLLRLQARMLDDEGDHKEAAALRARAARSERAVLGTF
jgi:hypothetical protein